MIKEQIFEYSRIVECTNEFIKSMKYDVRRFPLVSMNEMESWNRLTRERSLSRESNRLLIAAPVSDMKNPFKISERIQTEDPFVFSISKHGVIIFSAWGDEGNDELVQKYRALNEWLVSAEKEANLTS